MPLTTILLVILAIFLPPLAVFLVTGLSWQLLIDIILTLIGYIPGILYALWIVLTRNPG